ncbi:MoaD/ThiS family protein [Paraperlucidibaca sp.]|jgi:molybdopterin synthase sulfur carrier subunit|uniref:MoaD/ThiS family protein n=1 Tax=Paraperlucidibaca sp. TaxID=2708021 RepID=UPI0039894F7D
MIIELCLFARYREAVGIERERIEIDVTSIADLRDTLLGRGDNWAVLADPKLCCARNQTLCSLESAIADGDEIAFFPQMTGG